jgi:peptidoglycan/LPS O-acetylase OafA/YrhL
MLNTKSTFIYRKDIDGLRAIAVLAVILLHMGFLPNGYLGVDVFFVISGYLITKIAYKEVNENNFSIINFYLRRIRRIIPLVLVVVTIALILGLFLMLPDDLENLSQSVIATNFFANNILQLITTHNYWNIINEFKPLMHTWSLGVEEQFYIIFPIIFLVCKKEKVKWIVPIFIFLTLLSLVLYFTVKDDSVKFYSIQYRFFELSFGSLGAILFSNKKTNNWLQLIFTLGLLLVLLFDFGLSDDVKLFATLFTTLGILLVGSSDNNMFAMLLENKVMVWIGKISFSLYMWHQLVLAFVRYFISNKFDVLTSSLLFLVILALSFFSYFFIEQPFRDKNRIKTRTLLYSVSILFILSTAVSFYIYRNAGVIRDVPELDIKKNEIYVKMHESYNSRVFNLDKNFTSDNKVKVLIVGNSFARDWANVLLESKYKDSIEISYLVNLDSSQDAKRRLNEAKYIFFSILDLEKFKVEQKKYGIDVSKVWNVGTKSFGSNNGIFYNKRNSPDYCIQRTSVENQFLKINAQMKNQWKDRYIDIMGIVIDNENTMPVFTDDCKFISHDCTHFTQNGAKHFSKLLETKLNLIFQ